MMLYADLKAFIQAGLAGGPYENATIEPGPDLPSIPNKFAVLSPGPGPGLNTEGLIDTFAWQVRVAGEQRNYTDAEAFAEAIDKLLRSENGKTLGGVTIISSQRSGGRPYALLVDDADRTHFVCTYFIEGKSD